MAERIKLHEINRVGGRDIFFDANIWIYIYGPMAKSRQLAVEKYSKAFSDIVRNRKTICTDTMIMSEFINRYLRICYSNYKTLMDKPSLDFKKGYRITEDYKQAMKTVYATVKNKIIPIVNITNNSFTNDSFKELLDESNFNLDFNDSHICSTCNEHNMYLLTHDGDFVNEDIDVISFNNKYFS